MKSVTEKQLHKFEHPKLIKDTTKCSLEHSLKRSLEQVDEVTYNWSSRKCIKNDICDLKEELLNEVRNY